jgi:iron(III) transport system permease protein
MSDPTTAAHPPVRPGWLTGLALRLRWEHVVIAGVVAMIAYLALVPLGFLVWKTFVADGSFTLESFRSAYSAVGLGEMVLNSLWFAGGTTLVGVGLGTVVAYLVVRTDVGCKRLIVALTVTQLVIPGVLYTIAWIFLASPRTGALNTLLEPVLGPRTFHIFGLGGMVFVEGLHLAPLVFLLMAAVFRSMDAALEESALASGAGPFTVLRRITIPLARPALLAMVLFVVVRSLEAFEVPALLGIPGGVWVFTSRIWRALTHYPADYGAAGAYSLSLVLVTATGVFLLSRLSSRGQRFQTVTGKRRHARPVELGRWRWPLTAMVLGYLAVAVVLPLLVLFYVSTQRFYSPPTAETISHASLDAYARVLQQEDTTRALRNTVLLATGTATVVTLLGAIASWVVVRTRARGRWLVDSLAFLPITIPSLVLGTALLVVYLRVPLPVYGTLWILLIAFVTSQLPAGMRFSVASMHQVGDELEESAHASGANWWQTFRRVLFPLLLPGLAAAWIYMFVVSARQLSSAILLYSPGSEVLAVRLWDQYQQGQFTELAALGLMMTFVLVGLIALAYKVGGTLGLLGR